MTSFLLFRPLSAIETMKGADPSMANLNLSSPSSPSRIHIPTSSSFSLSSFGVSPRRPFFICQSSKKKESGFTDRILDYIEGGPKLRKWYGVSDVLPKDGLKDEDDEIPEIGEVRDAVLVTNGESEIGQMVILSLIVKRARVKALVKDKKASVDAFGTYVEALVGDLSNMSFLSKALRGVRAIICPANDGFFSDAGRLKGVHHVILLSQLDVYKAAGVFEAILNKKLRKFAERDEEVVITSGIPYTIVKAGLLQDVQGDKQGFCFDEGVASKGRLNKDAAAHICVEALDAVPTKGLIFEVVNGEEKVEDWKEWFSAKIRKAEELR